MLIVSQDEKCMTEDLNIYIKIHNPNFGEVIYAIENDEFVLGEYKTEERAKEVLQEIIAVHQASKMFMATKGVLIQEEMCKVMIEQGKSIFKYEMPKE